jgi:UDP-N-acetyl-D-glucosamine dehydrogenase
MFNPATTFDREHLSIQKRTAERAFLLDKIDTRTAHIGIIGLGYVGLPLALLFCEEQFPVTGFDIDPLKVERLNNSESYIARIPATEIQSARSRGLCATADFTRIRDMDAIVICVPTPLDDHSQPDLSYIVSTAHAVASHLRGGQLVVLESTTFPGTTDEVLVPILEKHNPSGVNAAREGMCPDSCFYVAYSPEREDPGNNTTARRDIPKVIGGVSRASAGLAAALYGSIFNRIVQVSTPAAAEMTKILENTYRCVNIALVNELKLLCLRMGIDIWEVIDAASTKPFGFHAFYPGPGLGGHCIPIDPFYLSWRAKQFDFHTRFIELAGEINTAMPYHVVETVASALNLRKKTVNGARILVLGIAYKKDVDDLRESPAIRLIELLREAGAHVSYHDPHFPRVGRGRHYQLDMERVALDNLNQYDCVLIVTDHSDYDYARIASESQLIIDTRNALRGVSASNIVRC